MINWRGTGWHGNLKGGSNLSEWLLVRVYLQANRESLTSYEIHLSVHSTRAYSIEHSPVYYPSRVHNPSSRTSKFTDTIVKHN